VLACRPLVCLKSKQYDCEVSLKVLNGPLEGFIVLGVAEHRVVKPKRQKMTRGAS
jgi:hypothetical protein